MSTPSQRETREIWNETDADFLRDVATYLDASATEHDKTRYPDVASEEREWAERLRSMASRPSGEEGTTASPGEAGEEECHACGAMARLVAEEAESQWGPTGPRVKYPDRIYRCPECGEGFYTAGMANRTTMGLLKATVSALESHLAEVNAEMRQRGIERNAALDELRRTGAQLARLREAVERAAYCVAEASDMGGDSLPLVVAARLEEATAVLDGAKA